MSEVKVPKKKVLLTARQVGIIASFGGLAFAWSALGIQIPLVPPYIIDIREPLVSIVGLASGPWAGLITGIIVGFPIYPFINLPYYTILSFGAGVFSKKIWNASGWKRYLYLLVVFTVLEAALGGIWGSYSCSIEFGIPFWDMVNIWFFTPIMYIYIAEDVIACALAMKLVPSLMEPRWLWGGGEAPPTST